MVAEHKVTIRGFINTPHNMIFSHFCHLVQQGLNIPQLTYIYTYKYIMYETTTENWYIYLYI